MTLAGNHVESGLLVLPGTRLTLAGTSETTHQGVLSVTSDSEHSDYAHADLDVTCRSTTRVPCEIDGHTVTPQRPGTFEITAVADGDHAHARRWTVTVLDLKRIELEPCGTVVAAAGERDVGVYAVGPEGRLKLAMPAAINGTPGKTIAISTPGTFELRATVAGITGACRVSVTAATP